MCGLTGLWEFDNTSRDTLLNVIESMTASLFHRGPDDGGYYLEPDCALALGFRRLAIVDLSPEGHQPMSSV